MVLLLLLLLAGGQAATLPSCENALPPGEGFGGSVTITADCIWRPQLHFISTLTGQHRPDYPGALTTPTIFYEAAPVSSQAGPGRLTLSNLVLANFKLSSPGVNDAPVLWPKGMLQPGLQPGSSAPRRLYMADVRMLVSAQTIQEYVRFFKNSSVVFWTDNSTFIHLPYWSDERTTAISVGLLLEVPGAEPVALARDRAPAGRNFVLAADFKTVPTILQSSASIRTSAPFLLYLATHVTLTPAVLGMPIVPINRPLIVVGKSDRSDPTSVDLGMAVNTLQLGPQGSVLFNQVILENLAPGDARTATLAGSFDPTLAYPVWAVAFDRAEAVTPRLRLQNVTMVMADVSLEQYLVQATVYRVRPAGLTKQLSHSEKQISQWEVRWAEDSESVYTSHFDAAAMQLTSVNMTSRQLMARALPLPVRNSSSTVAAGLAQLKVPEYQLTHVGHTGLHTMQLGAGDAFLPGARELIMLTSNITVPPDGAEPAAGPGGIVQGQLRSFLAQSLAQAEAQQHVLIGIDTPPVTLDLSYTQDLVQLPAALAPGHFVVVNIMMMHLSQGPKAAAADANVLLPDVWTHLLWGIRRETKNVVLLSNTTLWVPAAEFSFIRSHTATQPTSFTINLQGDANMRFYNVQDLRADGLFIERYRGPGLEAESLTLRVEPGWSMNGQPPRGFWAMQGFAPGFSVDASAGPPRMSDTMVVVLAVCLVTAVVVAVLACLAVLFYRKRAAERHRQAQQQAEAESGVKPANEPGGSQQGHAGNWDGSGSRGGGGSGLGILGGSHAARRSPGILPGLLRDSMPVHDSSDSFNAPEVVDRAALTAELAFSKFGPRNLALQDGSDGGSSDGGGGGGNRRGRGYGGGRLLPPGAAGAPSSTSMASDACLQRLQSAISVMSQDVLSRRLQYAAGPDGSPAGMGAGAAGGGAAGGLGRPPPLGLAQQQPWLTPPPEAALAEDGNQQQQQHSGSLARRSSSSLGRSSIHSASPRGAADAEQQDRATVAAAAGGDGPQQHAGLQGAAGTAAGGALAKSSYNSSCQSSRVGPAAAGLEQLKLLQLVGQGTFGQVYKALWRRRCVAVKVLQLPATAGSSDVPWRGMGRSTSHREKMAIMETVVSTTMSHPNIVQVYTYVLQPLMQGSMSRSHKQQRDSPNASRNHQPQLQQQQQAQQQRRQEVQELQPQPPLQDKQQQPQQPQEVELQQPRPQGVQGAAAQLLARITNRSAAKQQQEQQEQQQQQLLTSPDPGVPPEAEGQSPLQQQQQQQLEQLRRSSASGCDDSSLSLSLGRDSGKDLSRLTPEMAKAAAAALPGAAFATAAAAAAAAAGDGSGSSAGQEDVDEHQESDMPSGPVLVGWQLRLVMEYCDLGSLRTALDHKLLIDRTTGLPALECVLFLAHDVACALIHLHSEHLLHGDLKASNVLLKRTAPRLPLRQDQERPPEAAAAAAAGGAGGGGAHGAAAAASGGRHHSSYHHSSQAGSLVGGGLGIMAKVADFGLSLTLGPTDTHVSQMHMGTLTHMAPELLLHGRASKASDVYAFGILLWELATGRRPYSGTPVGMLAHKVVQQGWRPAWPGGCSMPIKMLVEHCWAQDAADRLCFEQVVQQLEEMASHLDDLKQQQAQAMAAAAAPLFHPAHGAAQDSEPGHELTPSMMAELMPSGFGPGSAPGSDVEEEAQGSGVLYEMSQLSGGSHDQRAAMHAELCVSDHDDVGFDAVGDAGAESPDVVAVSVSCSGEVGVGSLIGSRGSGSKHRGRLAVVR